MERGENAVELPTDVVTLGDVVAELAVSGPAGASSSLPIFIADACVEPGRMRAATGFRVVVDETTQKWVLLFT